MALRMPYKGMKLGSALPIVIPAPEPEPRTDHQRKSADVVRRWGDGGPRRICLTG